MKKILFCVLMFVPFAVMADVMCVRDSTLVVSLEGRPTSGGRSGFVWWADLSNGRIYGEATCLSEQESLGQTVQGSYYGAGDYANTKIVAEPGMMGYDPDGNVRNHCWLRLTHPASSAWVLASASQDCGTCFDYAYRVHVRDLEKIRKGLYGSVGL